MKVVSRKWLLLPGILILCAVYVYGIKRPLNSRDWEFGYETLPRFLIGNATVHVENIRDTEYTGGTKFIKHYYTRTFEIKDIDTVWFVVSKFSGFDGVAHTYFVFDMKDSEPVTVSVEARREKGEKYGITRGLLNNFELIYVWASERDALVRRTVINQDKVYMYPLNLPQLSKERLFVALAQRSQMLETEPRFYNTLLSNCTNELAKTANEVKPGAIPFNLSLILPGYSAEELRTLGYITEKGSMQEVEKKHYLTDFVRNNPRDPDLSVKIRAYLRK